MAGAPRRYKDGVTNVGSSNPLNMLGMLDPRKYVVEFQDFNDGWEKFAAAATYGWDVVTDTADTLAVITGANGILHFEISGTDDQVVVWGQSAYQTVKMTSGKKLWMGARIRCPDGLTNKDWGVGLAIWDTTPVATTPSEQLLIKSDDGDSLVDLHVVKDGAAQVITGAATNVTNTWEKYDVYFDGISKFEFYKDDTYVGNVTTTAFPTDGMGIIAYLQAGAGSATLKFDLDYVYVIYER